MSECPGCRDAEANPAAYAHVLYAQCLSCEARALAMSPACKRAMVGDKEELQIAMRKVFGNNYREGRVAVFGWKKRLDASSL